MTKSPQKQEKGQIAEYKIKHQNTKDLSVYQFNNNTVLVCEN